MPTVRLARVRTALAVLLALMVLAVSIPPATSDARPGASEVAKIYILRGGDQPSDAAVIAALRAAGNDVTAGVPLADFTGDQATLEEYDAVVALYSSGASGLLQPSGADALTTYVQKGGGLVAAEWLTYQADQQGLTSLSNLLPATSCDRNSASSTILSQYLPNPVIDAGLPMTFTVQLANIAGSEGCLEPKEDAALLYTSSNGGGQSGSAALVTWNPPDSDGRVAAFSSLLAAVELRSSGMTRLLQNTVAWVARAKDATPPTIKRFTIANAGSLSSSRDLVINVQASDRGGSRLGSYYLVEYIYSGNPNRPWRIAGRSGWLPYGNGANLRLSWQLTGAPGVHHVQLFLADRAGNISSTPGLDFVSYQPATASVAANQQLIYHIRPPAGDKITVRLDVASGNPDLYVFGPGVRFYPESNAPVEQVTFTPTGDLYQIEVEGYRAGSYSLSVGPSADTVAPSEPPFKGRPRSSIITLRSNAPAPTDADLDPAPAAEGPASVGLIIYMPLLER